MSLRDQFSVRNTRELITADTKVCELVYAPSKFGKTTYCATLDKLTRAIHNKPTLFIAVEDADGGGTMSIRQANIDFIEPASLADLDKLIDLLQTDEEYGGVVLDNTFDIVKKFIQPHALKFPCKERSAESRTAGVPVRSDYQVMGEMLRKRLSKLVHLTRLDNLVARKHVMVTGLYKVKEDDNNAISFIGPDLPGAMATSSPAVFQTVTSIIVKPTVVQGRQVAVRHLQVAPTNPKQICGDRMNLLPDVAELDKLEQYEKYWKPVIGG